MSANIIASKLRDSRTPKADGSQIAVESIFKRAGLPSADSAFTVYRLEELFADENIADLSLSGRVSAIRAILKSHGVDVAQLFDDAVARKDALEDHDERLRQNIAKVEEQVLQENATLQAEIEEFANPRLLRMEANEQRIERLQNDYERWNERKLAEQGRIVSILEPLGDDKRLRPTARVDAPASAAPKAVFSLSGTDVFDDPPGPAGDSGWELGDERSKPRSSVMVEHDLDAEFHAAHDTGEDLTGEFEFQRTELRVPSTPLEGLLAGLALIAWIVGGVLLAAQLVMDLTPVAAWGIGLGAPLVLALVTSLAFRRGTWWSGAFMMLFYFSVAAFVAAHYNPQNLLTSLQSDPLPFIGGAGLSGGLDDSVSNFTVQYASMLESALGLPHNPPAAAN